MSNYYWPIIFLSLADVISQIHGELEWKVPYNSANVTCEISTIADYVSFQHILGWGESGTAQSCINLCYKTELCFAVSFIKEWNHCYFHNESELGNLLLEKVVIAQGSSFNYFNCTKKNDEANGLKTLNSLMQQASAIDIPEVTDKHPMKVNVMENTLADGIVAIGYTNNVERCLDVCYKMPQCFRISFVRALSRCYFHNETKVQSIKSFSQLDVKQYFFVGRENDNESWAWVPDYVKQQIKNAPLVNVPDTNRHLLCKNHTTRNYVSFYKVTHKGNSNSPRRCLNLCYRTNLCFGISFIEQLNLCFFHNESYQNNMELTKIENLTVSYSHLDCTKKKNEIKGLFMLNQISQHAKTIIIPKVSEQYHSKLNKIKYVLPKEGIMGSGHSNSVDRCLNICYKMLGCFGISFTPAMAMCFFYEASTSYIEKFYLLDITFYFFIGYSEKTEALRSKYNDHLKSTIPQIAMLTMDAPLIDVPKSNISNKCKPSIYQYFSKENVLAIGYAKNPANCLSLCYNMDKCFTFTMIHKSEMCIFYLDRKMRMDIRHQFRFKMDHTHYDLTACESKIFTRLRQVINNFDELKKIAPAPQFSNAENISEICRWSNTLSGIYQKNAYARVDQISDVQHCLSICYHDEQCFSFTYQHVLKICILHDDIAQSDDDITEFESDKSFYSNLQYCPEKEYKYFMRDFMTVEKSTLDLQNDSADVEDVSTTCDIFETAGYHKENAFARIDQVSHKQLCLSICFNDKQCLSVTYHRIYNICVLHNQTTHIKFKESYFISYSRIQGCPKKYPSCWNTINSNSAQQCGIPSEQFLQYIDGFFKRNNRHRIMGGMEAAPRSFPWMAHLDFGHGSFCGGVLISKDTVLTAAHCLLKSNGSRKDVDTIHVYLGLHERIKVSQCQSIHKVAQFITHQQFKRNEYSYKFFFSDFTIFLSAVNDIGLIKLANPVKFFSDYIQPACLPANNQSSPSHKESCIVVGWGLTDQESAKNLQPAYKLQQLIQPILNDSQCKDFGRNDGPFYSDGQFCAGMVDRRQDSCSGDSGGPYMCYEDGQFITYGLVSYGPDCESNKDANKPSFYTKVSAYLDWIEETRNKW